MKSYSEFHEDVVTNKFLHAEGGVAEMLIRGETVGQGEGSIGYTNNMKLRIHKTQQEEGAGHSYLSFCAFQSKQFPKQLD